MCFTGLEILGPVMGAAGSLMQYSAKKSEAAAQNAYAERNRVAALAAQRDTQQSLTLRQMQEAGASKQAVRNSLVDQARRQASAIVSGVKAGVTGISLDNLVKDIGRVAEENRATLISNWEMTAAQLQAQKAGAEATYFQRANAVPMAAAPSPFTPLMGIAGAGINYFTSQAKAETAARV